MLFRDNRAHLHFRVKGVTNFQIFCSVFQRCDKSVLNTILNKDAGRVRTYLTCGIEIGIQSRLNSQLKITVIKHEQWCFTA